MTDKPPNVDGARKTAAMMLKIGLDAGVFRAEKGRLPAREGMLRDAEGATFDAGPAIDVADLAAAGDPDARLAVHTAIAAFVATDQPIPQSLRSYLFRLLEAGEIGPAKRGVNPHNDSARNDWFIATIRAVTEYGFEPTRNSASANKDEQDSACSIVRDELRRAGKHLEESALNKIWSGRTDYPQ